MTDDGTPSGISLPGAATSSLLTFLLADIRGYTQLTAEHGDEAALRLSERFLALCREVVSEQVGDVFGSAGDQVLAAFPSAHAAIRAALALQDRLSQEHTAHPNLPLAAGIGLDTVEAIRIGGDYRSNAINLAARLWALAGPGDIFASDTVLSVAHLLEGVVAVDRGEVRLKGLVDPVRIVQLGLPGSMPSALPPLQPLLVAPPTNLPEAPTPLEEHTLFARLSVFAGGCSFEAAEAVCSVSDDLDMLEGLSSLVAKSLVRQEGELDPRLRMLETIREDAEERLTKTGYAPVIRQAHAEFFLDLAERAAPNLQVPEQAVWLRDLETDHDNLRRVFDWAMASGNDAIALRLAVALRGFWIIRAYLAEGRRWLETVLLCAPAEPSEVRQQVVSAAASLVSMQDNLERGKALGEESLVISRSLGNTAESAAALNNLGRITFFQGDHERAIACYSESAGLWQELGTKANLAVVLTNLGSAQLQAGDVGGAIEALEESLALARQSGNARGIVISLQFLAGAQLAPACR